MDSTNRLTGAFGNGHAGDPNGVSPTSGNGDHLREKTAKKKRKIRCRAAWVSDLHMGTRMFQAALFLALLKRLRCAELYLNGDIFDVLEWNNFAQTHVDVVQKLLRKARKGTKVTCLPGNHDIDIWELLRHWFGKRPKFRAGKNIVIAREVTHTMGDGRKMMVLHGDRFDAALKIPRWLERLGNRAYYFSMWLDRYVNRVRSGFGFPPVDIASFLKKLTKRALQHIANFETLVADYAREHEADIINCGHIHTPEIRRINGVLYANSGAWVIQANCTVLIEDFEGNLILYRWDGEDLHEITREQAVPGAMSSV